MGPSPKAFALLVVVCLVAGGALATVRPSAGITIALVGVGVGVGRILSDHARRSNTRYRKIPDANDPRWLPADGRPQIVGRECATCGRKITVSLEGATCDTCSVACHAKCLREHVIHDHRPNTEEPYR